MRALLYYFIDCLNFNIYNKSTVFLNLLDIDMTFVVKDREKARAIKCRNHNQSKIITIMIELWVEARQ